MSRPRASSSPSRPSSSLSKSRSRPLTPFLAIPEDEELQLAHPHEPTRRIVSSPSSSGPRAGLRVPSSGGAIPPIRSSSQQPGLSSSRSTTPRGSIFGDNPKPPPRPNSTLLAGRSKTSSQQQTWPVLEDIQQDERDRQQAAEMAINSEIFQQAVTALHEMQTSLVISSYQAVLWESEARTAIRQAKKASDSKSQYKRYHQKHDQMHRDSIELLEARLRESIKHLRA